MKIIDYLHPVYYQLQILEQQVDAENEAMQIDTTPKRESAYTLESYAVKFEFEESIKKLFHCFKTVGQVEIADTATTRKHLECFKNFLDKRWDIIKGSHAAYFSSLTDPLTTICWDLALKLQPYFDIHHLKLLMPTIIEHNPIHDQTTLLVAEEQQNATFRLTEYVLCDENKYLINVFECLTDSIDDNKLKHTNTLSYPYPGREDLATIKLLSDKEVLRVINHSIEATTFHQVIQEYHHAMNASLSIGAAVNRLITSLREGGVKAQTRRTKRTPTSTVRGLPAAATEESVNGVTEFYEYLKCLNTNERNELFSLSATNNYTASTFEMCWYILLLHNYMFGYIKDLPIEEADYITQILTKRENDIIICVEQLADDFERMIKNSHLKHVIPGNVSDTAEAVLKPSREKVSHYQAEFSKATAAQKCHYLPFKVDYLKSNFSLIFTKNVYRELIESASKLVEVLKILAVNLHPELINQILKKTKLKKICKNLCSFLQVVMSKRVNSDLIILTLGYEHIDSLINNVADLSKTANSLRQPHQSALLISMGPVKVRKYLRESYQFRNDLPADFKMLMRAHLPKAEVMAPLENTNILFSPKRARPDRELQVTSNSHAKDKRFKF